MTFGGAREVSWRAMAEHGRGQVDRARLAGVHPAEHGVYIDSTWLTEAELSDHQAQQRLHPDVPRAVIGLVSQHLQSEDVAAFYTRMRGMLRPSVLNVFVRCDSGIVRVRLHPQNNEHLALATEAYASTAVVELEHGPTIAAEPAASVARAGREHLLSKVVAGGYDSFEAWMAALLTAEGVAWAQEPSRLQRPSRAVGPLSTILLGVHGLLEDTAPLMLALAEHSVFADLLEGGVQDTAVTRTILPALAQAAASVSGQDEDHVVLANTGAALQKLAGRMDEPLREIAQDMVRVRRQVNRVRMAVAAAHMLADVLGREAVTRITTFQGEVDEDLARLCRAVEQAVSEMAVEAANLSEELGPLADRCDTAIVALAEFHRWVKRYRLMVSRIPDATHLSDLTAALDQHLASEESGPLGHVALACRALHIGFDVESLVGHLHDIRGAGSYAIARRGLTGWTPGDAATG